MRFTLLVGILISLMSLRATAQEPEFETLVEEGEAQRAEMLLHTRTSGELAKIDLEYAKQAQGLVQEFHLTLIRRLDELALTSAPAEIRDLRTTSFGWVVSEDELEIPKDVPAQLAGVVGDYRDALAAYGDARDGRRLEEYRKLIQGLDEVALHFEEKDPDAASALREQARALMPRQSQLKKFGKLEVEAFEWYASRPTFIRVQTHGDELLALGHLQGNFNGGGVSQMIGFWDKGKDRGLIGHSGQHDVSSVALAIRDPRLKLEDCKVGFAEVNAGERRVKLIHSSRGFCHLVGVGGLVRDFTRYEVSIDPDDGFYYFTGRVEDESAVARAAIIEYPEDKVPEFEISFVTWKKGDPARELIDAEDGICLISSIRGGLAGAGEMIFVRIGSDGRWRIGGRSNVVNTSVTALVLKLKE